ncbi:hypothetical protein SAMN02745704_00513 [Paucidesulfovibrio gracilis DSM 16080]|uniref:Dicarboxylate transport n=2 Tax=Paucidesulfovibrio TaxID=2910985 RepID=A0A1T4W8U2_9BACT|nr:hypothetical protein SAMN02745704_00513 [Paucidesulfovibrio gracilis DSM 16080]
MRGVFYNACRAHQGELLLWGALILACVLLVWSPVGAWAGTSGPLVVVRDARGEPWLRFRPVGALQWDGTALRGTLRLDSTEIETPWIRGSLRGNALARLDGSRVLLEEFDFYLNNAAMPVQEAGETTDKAPLVDLGDLRLRGSGVWHSGSGRLELSALQLEAPDGARLTGELDWDPRQGLRTDLSLAAEQGDALVRRLARVFPASLEQVAVSGPLQLGMRLEMLFSPAEAASSGQRDREAGQVGQWNFGLDVRQSVRLAVADALVRVPRLNAEVQLLPGSSGAWDASGRVAVRGRLHPGGVELVSPKLSFDAGVSGKEYHFRRLRLESAEGLVLAGRKLPVRAVTLRGRLTPRADQGWHAHDLRVSLPGATLAGEAHIEPDGTVRTVLQAGGMDLERIGPVLGTLAGLDGLTAQGRAGLSVSVEMGAETITGDVRLHWREAAYMSGDAQYMAQGLEGSLRLRSRLSMKTLRRWVNADLRLDGGELLFGPTYLDLAGHPLRFTGNANQIGADRFKDLQARLDWQGYGTVEAEGDLWAHGPLSEWRCRAGLDVEDLNLGPVFASFVSTPMGLTRWQGENAGLGGTGHLTLSLYSDGTRADLEGRMRLVDASLRSAEGGVDVRGANLDLPVRYRLKGEASMPGVSELDPEETGALRVGHLHTPWSERENLAFRLALVPNRLYWLDPVAIPLFGGRIRLEDLQWDRPLSRSFKFGVNASFRGIDLAQWSREGVPLRGVLEGDLGRITATRHRISIPGAIRGTFFQGRLRADRLFMDWPFEARRQFGGEVSVRGMDLESLSGALGVGRVTGLLDLDLQDFLFAFGQPAQFTLTAQTSGEGDFEKSVSLKAVNSLSVIGTGSGLGDVGVGLFASFFEEFSYARIGFQCILNNDRFQVRGLIREGGVEYLIKKPFLTGINVVNGNPENFISFADMLERMQRVVKGSAQAAPQ